MDRTRDLRLVHGIKMNIFDAVRIQVDDLIGRIGDARLHHSRVIGAEAIDKRLEPLRNKGTGQLNRAFELDRLRDADLPPVVQYLTFLP